MAKLPRLLLPRRVFSETIPRYGWIPILTELTGGPCSSLSGESLIPLGPGDAKIREPPRPAWINTTAPCSRLVPRGRAEAVIKRSVPLPLLPLRRAKLSLDMVVFQHW